MEIGRQFAGGFIELIGAEVPIYLLQKQAGTPISPAGEGRRSYDRHWSPVHFDFVVEHLDQARECAIAAGAVKEGETSDAPYGRLAMFADPFGHGFCLIEFNALGYDALL